jgi:hypothetical protein
MAKVCAPFLLKLLRGSEDVIPFALSAFDLLARDASMHDHIMSLQNFPSTLIELVSYISSLSQLILSSYKPEIAHEAIKIIGNLLSGSDTQTDALLKAGLLNAFSSAVEIYTNYGKEICWAVSNITAGTDEQAKEVLESNFLNKMMSASSEFDQAGAKQATWALCNVAQRNIILLTLRFRLPQSRISLVD